MNAVKTGKLAWGKPGLRRIPLTEELKAEILAQTAERARKARLAT